MSDETTTTRLIRTKLHRFTIPEGYVHRPRLVERLEQNRQRPLTLVCAPAGYGKSTLVSSWLQACASPSAWVSLDKNDNDLHLFLNYFLAAVRTMFPDAVSETMTLVNTPTLPPLTVLAGSLANELDLIKQDFILVLDDIHRIREESVYKLLTELLNHPPRSMHLVLVGRLDPSLPIAFLRAREQVTEVRLFDLRFSTEETAEFLQIALGEKIDEAQVAALAEKTEGWVTGLRLACLSMLHRNDLDPGLLEPHVDAQFVMEYLFTEVFSHQPQDVTRYLLGTSVLDRFCGPLCEAVCVSDPETFACEMRGWEFIKWLRKENIFLIPLDPEKRWFRYHHLFQKLLVKQLNRRCSTKEIKAIHAQAGAWLAENGIIEEAVHHYLDADDIPAAIRLVARHGHSLMNNQQWPDLERLIGLLPRDHVEQDPELLIFEAWHHHVQTCGCDLKTKITINKKIERLINNLSEKVLTPETEIIGHFEALRGMEFYLAANGENALKYFRSACDKIPMHHKRARVSAHLFLAAAYQMIGDLETGFSIYNDEIQESVDQGSDYYAPYIEKLCYLHWMNADLVAIRQTAERSIEIAMKLRLAESVAFALYFLGTISYHQNKLKIAEERLTQLVNDRYFLNVVMAVHGSVALAMVYMARGEFDQAEQYCKKALNYAIDTNNQEAIRIIRTFEAEYALRRGHIAKAWQWAERFRSEPFTVPYLFYFPHLTLVRILMARDTSDSRQQAADLLNQLDDFLTSIHNKQFQVNVLALQAVHYDTLGEQSAALDKLTKALNLAEPNGFIRLFVDLGPQMGDLLKRLQEKDVAVDYIEKLLAVFREDKLRMVPDAPDHESRSPHPPVSPSPIPASPQLLEDPLTNRELDILELLAQRLQNKEIADKSFISTETVKTHLNKIYRKLNVSNRREAVTQAYSLGILNRR